MLYDDDLLHGDPKEVAAFLGISARQLRNYKTGKTPLPDMAKKLLRLRLEGDLSSIGGEAWAGFYLQRQGLFLPLWERSFQPEQIKAMFFEVQELAALRRQVRELKAQLWARDKLKSLQGQSRPTRRYVAAPSLSGRTAPKP